MSKKTFAILAATISVIAGVISIITFVTGKSSLVDPSKQFRGKDLIQSPWLGVEFYQNNLKTDMILSEPEGMDGHLIHVSLSAEPFDIIVPDEGDLTHFYLAVSKTDSILLDIHRGKAFDDIPNMGMGATFAVYHFADPTLMISQTGHAYYTKSDVNRLYQRDNHKLALPITKIWDVDADEKEHHVRSHGGELYMLMVMDKNLNRLVDHTEFEFFQLAFD